MFVQPLDERGHTQFGLWFKEKLTKFKNKIDVDAKTFEFPVRSLDDLANIEAKLTKKAFILVRVLRIYKQK